MPISGLTRGYADTLYRDPLFAAPGIALGPIAAALDGDVSAAIIWKGDSTSNEVSESAYLLTSRIAALNPYWNVRYRLWDDSTSLYAFPTTVQTGTNGERYLGTDVGISTTVTSGASSATQTVGSTTGMVNGGTLYFATANAYRTVSSITNATTVVLNASVATTTGEAVTSGSNAVANIPDSSFTHISGDMDVRVKVAATKWNNGLAQVLAAHYGSAGNRSWLFQIGTSGVLQFNWSQNGTNNTTVNAGTPSGLVDGTATWLRATLDIDDGAGNYVLTSYQSSNGTDWTQITAVTTAGALTGGLFDSTADYEIGARAGASYLSGKFYEVEIRNGIDGQPVTPVQIEQWDFAPSSSNYMGGSPTFDVLNASVAGKTIPYFTDGTRGPRIDRNCRPLCIIVNLGHNHQKELDATWTASLASMVTQNTTHHPSVNTIFLTQNPVVSPGIYGRYMSLRRLQTIAYAAGKERCGAIDTYRAFLLNNSIQTSYIQSDGVHPTNSGATNGSALIADVLESVLRYSRR